MKTTLENLDKKITKAKTGLKDKEGVDLRTARKKVKRLQRRKNKTVNASKRAEEKAKGKKKAKEESK